MGALEGGVTVYIMSIFWFLPIVFYKYPIPVLAGGSVSESSVCRARVGTTELVLAEQYMTPG